MRIIELDATSWATALDFYAGLFAAIGAPEWHGKNMNALTDSMIWGGINTPEPPYTIRIWGVAKMPKDARDEIELAKRALAEARTDFRNQRGRDVDVEFEIAS